MSELKLWLLGPPRLEQDGHPIDISRRKAMALLVYLAVTQRDYSRDTLAALFWPEAGSSQARGVLRRVLSDLRKLLGEIWLETEGELVAINPEVETWVDVAAFRQLLAAAQSHTHPPGELCAVCLPLLIEAVALYRDDFLAGFTLPDSPAFDEWQFFQTESLRRELAETLERLGGYYQAQGELELALRYVRQWVAVDPLLEAPQLSLMALYAELGQRPAALRQYQVYSQLLAEELNAAPSQELTALYEHIRRSDIGQPGRARGSRVDSITQPPLPSPATRPPTPVGSEPAVEEIRLVTVLFIGLSSAAEMPDEDQFEATVEATHRFTERVTQVATAYGARIEGLAGGGVQVIFGLTQVHEDDPERAIRVALELREVARQHQFDISAGISTGQVYVGPAGRAGGQEIMAIGPIVHLAARLRDRAAGGETLVSAATYRHTRRAFDFSPRTVDLGSRAEPVTAYVVNQVLPHPEKVRGIEGLPSEIIGRTEELRQLHLALTAVRQGQGQVVSVIGEAGLGKSRLLAEVKEIALTEQAGLSAPLWLEGRCLEFRSGTSYWPFIDILQSYLSICSDDEQDRAACLVASLNEMVRRGDLTLTRSEEIGALLGNLLSLHFDNDWDTFLQHANPAQLWRQTFAALSDFFKALARQQPLVLVFEDLHWADTLSLDLLTLLLEAVPVCPLLLLWAYRHERYPQLQRLATLAPQKCPGRYTELRLRELTPEQSLALIETLLATNELSSAIKELILQKARGNPFFIEEAIRALIDAGAIYQSQGCWLARLEVEAIAVPESVQGVILSRIDHLGADLKRLLQSAAVIGRLFRPQVLARLIPPEVDLTEVLYKLEEMALIYQERALPEIEYSFNHVLTQETVYQTLSRRQRAELHHRVAETIEQLYADNLGEYDEQLAYHYDRSEEVKKAVEYLLRAGEKSRRAYLNDEAIHYFRRVLQRLDEWPEDHLLAETTCWNWQLAALTGLGQIYYGLGQGGEAERYFRQAIKAGEQAKVTPQTLVRLYAWLGEVLHWQGRYHEQIRLGEDGLRLLPETATGSVEAVLMNQTIAIAHLSEGNWELFEVLTAQTATFIQQLPYTEELRSAYLHIVMGLYHRHQLAQAAEWLQRLENVAEQQHDLRALAEVYDFRLAYSYQTGALQAAIGYFPRTLQLYTRIGDNGRIWRCLGSLVWGLLLQGNLAEAEKYGQQELEVAQNLGLDIFIAETYLNLGMVFMARQGWAEAAEAFQKAMQFTTGVEVVWEKWTAAYCLGRVYLAQGQKQAAFSQFQAAMALCTTPLPLEWSLKWGASLSLLGGLEAAAESPEEFYTVCSRFETVKPQPLALLLPSQWYLEPIASEVNELASGPFFHDPFRDTLAAGWHWQDPLGDCRFIVQQGLEIRAANGRDLWYINQSAPRLLRSVSGDFIVQTICTPVSSGTDQQTTNSAGQKPAMGGLLLWKDCDNFLRLVWGNHGPSEIAFDGRIAREDVLIGRGHLPGLPGQDEPAGQRVFLRLVRRGDQIQASCSQDGLQWFRVGQVVFPAAGPVEAGLHAVGWIDRAIYPGTYDEGTAIRFEVFQLWEEKEKDEE